MQVELSAVLGTKASCDSAAQTDKPLNVEKLVRKSTRDACVGAVAPLHPLEQPAQVAVASSLRLLAAEGLEAAFAKSSMPPKLLPPQLPSQVATRVGDEKQTLTCGAHVEKNTSQPAGSSHVQSPTDAARSKMLGLGASLGSSAQNVVTRDIKEIAELGESMQLSCDARDEFAKLVDGYLSEGLASSHFTTGEMDDHMEVQEIAEVAAQPGWLAEVRKMGEPGQGLVELHCLAAEVDRLLSEAGICVSTLNTAMRISLVWHHGSFDLQLSLTTPTGAVHNNRKIHGCFVLYVDGGCISNRNDYHMESISARRQMPDGEYVASTRFYTDRCRDGDRHAPAWQALISMGSLRGIVEGTHTHVGESTTILKFRMDRGIPTVIEDAGRHGYRSFFDGGAA